MDYDRIMQAAQEIDEKNASQAEEAQPEKSTWERLKDWAENTASDVYTAAKEDWEAGQQYLREQQRYIPDTAEEAYENQLDPESTVESFQKQDQDAALQSSIQNYQAANTQLAVAPIRETSREFVNAYADDDSSMAQDWAQSLQKSSLYYDYIGTDEEKANTARKVAEKTGIGEDILLHDEETWKGGLQAYREMKKDQDAQWALEKYPELQDIASKSEAEAIVALHHIAEVSTTHGIIETVQHAFEQGNRELEYNNLMYKVMMGDATEDDRKRAAELRKEIEADRQQAPSIFDDPLAAMAGAVASSAPEMWESFEVAARDAAVTAAIGAAVGFAAGGAGAAPGMLAGGVTGFVRSLVGKAAFHSAVGGMFRVGMWRGMLVPEAGSRYAQYTEAKDENGNPLYTDQEAKNYAMLGGALNAGIEMADFGLITKSLTRTPFTQKVLGDIIAQAAEKETAKESLKLLAREKAADMFKITLSESGEEALQSAADDLMHNEALREVGADGRRAGEGYGYYSAGEIAGRATNAFVESLPGSLGFGLMGGTGGMMTGSASIQRAMRNHAKFVAKYGEDAKKTVTGAMMYEQLQQAVSESKLQQKAPDINEKVLKKQLEGTGFETVYVDTEMAQENANGMEDLKKVAKAGGYTDEELQTAIQEKGHLVISGERFAQAGTSPELLEDVSFSQDADSFARMRHDAKATLEEVQQQMQKTLDKQTKLIEGIADEYFPTDKDGMKNKAQRETLMSAVIMRPENPAQGWRQMRKDLQAELDNAIAPALQALHEGMGKGGIILPTEDENGNKTYVRASENDEWYRNFYKLYKRQPTKAELEDMAIAMVTGDPSAPKVPGWVATDKETAKAMAQTKKTIDAIRKQLQVLDDVKEAASSLTGAEVNAIQGLTPEGYHVYRAITQQLRSAGGATSRVARLNAILFARHADIYADIVTKKTGKKYTALDYMRERYGLDLTGNEAAIQKAAEADSQQGTNFAQSVSPKKQLEADEKQFAAAIDDYMSKTDDKGTDKKPVFMMMTPLALNLAGTRTLPIYIDRSILHKVLIVAEDKAKGTHGHANEMSPEILKQLPRKLADPLLIFRSFDRHGKEEPNKRVIVVDLKDRNGATVIVSFVLETRGKVNKIASVYGKGTPTPNNKWITDRINNKALLYVNKKRTTHWLDELARPPIGPLVGDSFDLSSTLAQLKTNYKTENDLKTLKNANPSLYQMAGEKAGTANLQTLQRAQNMEREGKDADTIWNETGWTKGRDGKWRFEIPDELDKVNLENLTDEGTQYLKDVYDNPALYAAYPDLAYVLVQTSNELGKDTNGAVAGDSILLNLQKLDDKDMPVTLIHEIQHLIQHKEGFASGGAPSAANRLAERLRDKNFDAKQAFNQANDTLRAIDYVRTTRNWEKHPRSVMKSSIYMQTGKIGMPKGKEAQQEYLAKAVDDSKRAWRAELLEKGGFYSLPELEAMSDRKLQNYEKTVRRVIRNSEAGSDLYDEMSRFANTKSEEERYEFYQRLAGEQEARMTEDRAKNAETEKANRKCYENAEKNLRNVIKDLPANQQKAVKDFISSRDYDSDEAMAVFDDYPDTVVDAMADVMSAYSDSNASNSRPIPHNADAIILFGGKSFKLQIGEESAKKPKNPSLYQMASADTRTEAFKKWFGNSKIVNEDGSPKVVYHGTATDNIRIFDRKKAQDKAGRQIGFGWGKGKFYFTESEMMANAAGSGAQSRGQGEHPQAMPVYLRVEKPISAESYAERFKEISGGRALSPAGYDDSYTMEDRDRLIAKLDRQLKKEGYDGIIDEMSGAIAVFDNKQIKSVNNQGTFDSNNPNIFYQSAWHGSPYDFNKFDLGKIGAGEGGQAHGWGLYFAADRVISNEYKEQHGTAQGFITPFSNGKRIITLLEGADESTFAHEMSHMFLMDLEDLAQIDDVSAKELEVVDKWAEWHEGAAKEYRRTPWAKEFRAREKRILDAEAAGDTETAEREKQQWRQERFARGWELYLKEGKAPARGLKAVFRKFSDFLRRIYLAFTSDGGKPSESVRRVMDRMIATEDEIEEASLNDRFKDVSEAGGEKLYDETEEQTYKRWHEEAKEEAKEKLRKIVMKDLEQKNKDDFEEKVNEERERYTEYLQNQNVYLAEQAIKESGGDESMAKVFYPSIEAYKEERQSVPSFDEALESHMKEYRQQLDASLIDQHLTPEAVDEAMTSAAYHQKLLAFEATAFAKKQSLIRKISEKTEAAMRSVEDKIEALPDDIDLKVERRTGKVKDIMQAINKLRFSAKWAPDDYQVIERMIHSATKDEVREAMQEFRKQAREDKMNEQAVLKANEGKMQFYRELAEKAIENKPVHEATDVWGYRREAKKAAKRAEQMIHAKRWDVALQAKQQQAMLELEARAAEKMHARVEKLTKRVKQQLSARSVHLPQDERYWHRHLAYELGLAQTDAMEPNGHDSGPDGKPVSGKDIMQLNYLVRMFDAMEKNMDIPDASGLKDILNVITMKDTDEEGNQYRVKRWQRLNIHELEDAVDTLTVIYATGRDRFRMKTIGGKDIADVVQEIVSGPGEAKRMHVTKYNISENTDEGGLAYNDWLAKVPGIGKEMAKRGQEYISSMLQPEKILDALGPAARKYIYGTYERAAEREGEMMADAVEKLRKIFSVYSRAEKANWKDKTMKLQTSVGIEPVSKQTVLCMALNFGTESNRQRLCGGLGVTQTDMQTFLEEHMTEKDWKVVQQVWNLISSYWDETVQVEEKLNGVSLKKVEPAPVKMRTADDKTVDLPGGYYPVAYDPEKSSRAADLSNNAEVKRQMSGAQTLGLNRDFVKSRSEAPIERPLLLDLSVLPDHIGQVIHNIGYRVAARDVYRLVNHPDFEEYVTDSMGRTYHQVLKEWATDVWAQTPGSNNQASKLIDSGFEMLRRNSVMAIMGYRLWPVVENASNLGPVMDKIGAKKTFEAVGRFYGKWKESKKLLEKSVFMQNRINSMDRDIRQQPGILSAPSKLGLSADIIKRHAYDMMLYSDLALSAPLWVQSYRDAFPKMVLEVKAQNEANIQAMQEAQERVDKLHSLQLDREDHAGHLRLALGAWRKNDMDTVKAEIDTLNSSPFEMRPRTTPENLREELADVEHAQKEDQQEIREAELALDKALDFDVLTDQEMLQEAENRAVMKADAAVRDTFGSGETKNLSSIQRQHGLYRALTTFYSFFNTQFNAIFAQYIHAKYSIEGSAIKRWAPFARTMLYRIVIMGMISAALKTVLGTGSDDDKDKWRKVKDPKTGEEKKVAIPKEDRFLKEWEMNMISTMTGGFFILRDVSTMLMNLAFEGTTYGRSLNPFSVAFRSYDEGMKAIQMLAKKGERDLEIEEQEQKREQEWQERLRKLRGRKRQEAIRQHEEDEKYRKPPQRYTYSDIARRFGSAGSSATGFPVTLTDAVTGTMQYLNDADGRYDPTWQNIFWSALFDKKPVEREIPEKPKAPEKDKKKKKRSQ